MDTDNLDIDAEFDTLLSRVRQKQYFAFSRFGDGEVRVLKEQSFTCPEWQLSGSKAIAFRQALADSLFYQHPDYLVGIPCSCREHVDRYRAYLLDNFDLSQTQLTFAALFVNAMYRRLQRELVPELKAYPVVLIANENTRLDCFQKHGFNVKQFFPVPNNAWLSFDQIVGKIIQYLDTHHLTDHLFLLSAGPVANIIIPALHKRHPQNTYLDIGSSLNAQLGLPQGARNYLQPLGWKRLARCVWHQPTKPGQISCSSLDKGKAYRLLLRLRALATYPIA